MEDAEVLKELYESIKQNSKADYAGIIEQRASYPYLYHLSQIRENLVSFLRLIRICGFWNVIRSAGR